jgi:Raf kinase inhibitor-like YbhB/YbcL family protein
MMGTKLYFLDSATHYNGDHSPPFTWTGAPAAAKSFAISLTDMSEQLPNGKSHWVLWDIPATVTSLPADLPKVSPLTELGGAKQLNLVGGKGYFGPGARGSRPYRFTIWALDVATLPGSNTSLDTIIRTTLPAHKLGTATLDAIGPA